VRILAERRHLGVGQQTVSVQACSVLAASCGSAWEVSWCRCVMAALGSRLGGGGCRPFDAERRRVHRLGDLLGMVRHVHQDHLSTIIVQHTWLHRLAGVTSH
jgi:hypothetical protein